MLSRSSLLEHIIRFSIALNCVSVLLGLIRNCSFSYARYMFLGAAAGRWAAGSGNFIFEFNYFSVNRLTFSI